MLAIGAEIGYFSGQLADLVDDLQELKPTVLPGVPRVYDKIYLSITESISTKRLVCPIPRKYLSSRIISWAVV